MAKPIERGDFVIIDDTDAPHPDMVVLVSAIRDGIVSGDYVSRRAGYDGVPRGAPARAVPLADFGVSVSLEDDLLFVAPVRESQASYPDGAPRRWQGYGCISTRVRPELLERVAAAVERMNGSDKATNGSVGLRPRPSPEGANWDQVPGGSGQRPGEKRELPA